MLQKSGGHQFIWLPSLKQTARTWNTVVGFDEFPFFKMASWQLRTVSFGECNIWKDSWNITWNGEFSFIIPTGWLNFLPSSVKNRNDENCWLWTLAFKGVPSSTRIFHKIVTLLHVNESKVSPKALAIYDPLSPPAIFFQSAAKATPQHVPRHPRTCLGRALASPRKSMPQKWFPNTSNMALSSYAPAKLSRCRILYHQGAWS